MLTYLVNLIFLVGGLYTLGLFIEIIRALIRKTPARDIYESLFTKKFAIIICLIVLIDTPIAIGHSITTRIPEKIYSIPITLKVPEKSVIATANAEIEYFVDAEYEESGRDSEYLFGISSGDSVVVTEKFLLLDISYKDYAFSDVISDLEYEGIESGQVYDFTIGIPAWSGSSEYLYYPATIRIPNLTLSLLNITREDQLRSIPLSSYFWWGAVIIASIFNLLFLIHATAKKDSKKTVASKDSGNTATVNIKRDIPAVKSEPKKNPVELEKEAFFSELKHITSISRDMSDRVFDQKQIITDTFRTNGKDLQNTGVLARH